jgi:hypothetical protein
MRPETILYVHRHTGTRAYMPLRWSEYVWQKMVIPLRLKNENA